VDTAQQVYEKLLVRIRRKIYAETEVVLDFATGVQRKFLRGKLIAQKKVKTVLRLPPPQDTK